MKHLALIYVPEDQAGFGPYRRLLLMKRSPFTAAEGAVLMRGIALRGLHAVFVPHGLTSIIPFRDLLAGTLTAEAVVAEYASHGTRLAPVTDDRPFFVYLSMRLPHFFVPLMAVLAGVSGVFAVLPAVARRRRSPLKGSAAAGQARRGESGLVLLPFGLLFALLGAGFMLLEIPLIQQFILFLGHPTLSLAVVLFALLLGTAAGSAWTQRWPLDRLSRRVALAALLVPALSLSLYVSVPILQRELAGATVPARAVTAGLPVLLLGIALGMPFPTGLRLVRLRDPAAIPWAWGINGLMSVFGSVLAMSLALLHGFRATFVAGAAAYVLVAILMSLLPRPRSLET
jgi:hypothetical protein